MPFYPNIKCAKCAAATIINDVSLRLCLRSDVRIALARDNSTSRYTGVNIQQRRTITASSSASEQTPKKRKVAVATYRTWREDFDKELKTVSWLDCDSEIESGKTLVKRLKCSVCTKFRSRIMHRRNFSDRRCRLGTHEQHT